MENYAVLIDENKMYPVTYTIDQKGNKITRNTLLKGGDMTESQIKDYLLKEFHSTLKGLISDVDNLLGENDIEWQQAGYFEHAKQLLRIK